MPDPTFWLDWIQERIQASGSDPALLDGLDGCFKIALSNCASVQIAQEWINNILHRHEAGLMVLHFLLFSFTAYQQRCISLIKFFPLPHTLHLTG